MSRPVAIPVVNTGSLQLDDFCQKVKQAIETLTGQNRNTDGAALLLDSELGKAVSNSALIPAGITARDMSALRTQNVTYQNDSGHPLFVQVVVSSNAATIVILRVEGFQVNIVTLQANLFYSLSALVMPGRQYDLIQSGAAFVVNYWHETR